MAEIIFQTDQTGANQNICATAVASTVTFNFSLSGNYTAYSANITIKKASGTTDPVEAKIYSQPNGGGSVVASSSVLASAVTQSFSSIEFLFLNANLTANTSYSLVLSSITSCSGNSPYSFKSGNFQIIDKSTGSVINTGYAIVSNIYAQATLAASSRINRSAASSFLSSSSLTANAIKSKAMILSSSVVSLLSSAATVARSASIFIQSKSNANASPSLEANSLCEIKNNSNISSIANLVSSASSEMKAAAQLESVALITKNLICTEEITCSVFASTIADFAANSTAECSSLVEAELSGAKSLFSVSSSIKASSKLMADASVEHPINFNGSCDSTVIFTGALSANGSSEIVSTSLMLASINIFKTSVKKKREGSGHYVLNKGAFIFRQWKRFNKASDNYTE